jgi:hypothetical protein
LRQTGEPETDESQRIRELLTGNGGYIFHGTRVTGLTWAYRLSGGKPASCTGHRRPHLAQDGPALPARRDGLPCRRRRQRLQDDREWYEYQARKRLARGLLPMAFIAWMDDVYSASPRPIDPFWSRLHAAGLHGEPKCLVQPRLNRRCHPSAPELV